MKHLCSSNEVGSLSRFKRGVASSRRLGKRLLLLLHYIAWKELFVFLARVSIDIFVIFVFQKNFEETTKRTACDAHINFLWLGVVTTCLRSGPSAFESMAALGSFCMCVRSVSAVLHACVFFLRQQARVFYPDVLLAA